MIGKEGKMKITEAEFMNSVIEWARLCGWKIAHFRSVKVQRIDGTVFYQTPVLADGAGFPDLCLVRGSRLLFAELKSDNGKLSNKQKEWLDNLNIVDAVRAYVWKPVDWDRIVEILR